MSKKKWIILIVVLVLIVTVIAVFLVNRPEGNVNGGTMNVQRDETVNIDKYKENFKENIENIKDKVNENK